jgi:predicted glycosyltransferase involved in capsule biosynthesis
MATQTTNVLDVLLTRNNGNQNAQWPTKVITYSFVTVTGFPEFCKRLDRIAKTFHIMPFHAAAQWFRHCWNGV